MPIFEYSCGACGREFEKLLLGSSRSVSCPGCGSGAVERRPSTFGMSGVERQTRSRSGCASCSSASCASCGSV